MSDFDLGAYFARIGEDGPRAPTLDTLRRLHFAHATSIPFENVDIQLGRPVQIDLGSVVKKIVHARRGGYCFEQNTLFAEVLRRLGFRVTTLAARVRWMAASLLPRTHMLLLVDVDGARVVADVGFGGVGLTGPLRLVPNEAQALPVDTYRFAQEGPAWVLQARLDGAWADLYAFTLEDHFPIDYEMGNWFTSSHPSSRFVQSLACAIATRDGRVTLRNRELTVRGAERVERVTLDDAGLVRALRERFGIDVPGASRFRFMDAEA